MLLIPSVACCVCVCLVSVNFDGGAGGKAPIGLAMLNDKHGAVYFWLIVAAIVLLVITVFYQRGWVRNFIASSLAVGHEDSLSRPSLRASAERRSPVAAVAGKT